MSGGFAHVGVQVLTNPPTLADLKLAVAKQQKINRMLARMGAFWAVFLGIWLLVLGGTLLYAAYTVTHIVEQHSQQEIER